MKQQLAKARWLMRGLTALLLSLSGVQAQQATGTISGQVVSTDGQPLPRAKIQLIAVGDVKKAMTMRREVYSDGTGRFEADKLEPAAYLLTASAPGYVLLPHEQVSEAAGSAAKYVHVGEAITIRMQRGGVITGRVLNTAGEPVVGITLEATRLQDERGRPVTAPLEANALGLGRQTDDRGVYRMFGLAPGTYVVSVGAGALGATLKPTPFVGRAKIYYPASTRDTATEVVVQSGAEISGIDLRYRAERGAALTGKVLGAPSGGTGLAAMMTTMVTLTKAGTDTLLGTSVVMPLGENTGYSFYGLPNGDYEVTAVRPEMSEGSVMMSLPRRVSIKGNDVIGVDLRLAGMASVSGTIGLEKLPAPAVCKANRDSMLEEIVLAAQANEAQDKTRAKHLLLGLSLVATANEQGAFTIHGLTAGHHFLTTQLPDEHWYVKSVALTSAPANNPVAREAGRYGLQIKAGEKLTGLRVTLAEGAAGVKGKVIANGQPLTKLRLHLLPAEPEAKDEVLRFAETRAEENGSFVFTQLAPGKYLVLARAIPETESPDKPAKPVAWDVTARAKLRQEAEAAKTLIEVKTCQRVMDFVLRTQ